MWRWLQSACAPPNAYRIATRVQPWVGWISLLTLCYGLYAALVLAPADYQQGDAFRLLYVHVPAALGSLLIYAGMSAAALVFLIWKLKVANLLAEISAGIGAIFTAICLLSGALWGKPTWGTYWIWDARLTSELLLLFIYCGIIALRRALPEPMLAAKVSAVMILIGAVNLPIIHYSVVWWRTLHQGASLSLTGATIASSMLRPLLFLLCGFMSFYVWYLLVNLRRTLLSRERETQWVRDSIRVNE